MWCIMIYIFCVEEKSATQGRSSMGILCFKSKSFSHSLIALDQKQRPTTDAEKKKQPRVHADKKTNRPCDGIIVPHLFGNLSLPWYVCLEWNENISLKQSKYCDGNIYCYYSAAWCNNLDMAFKKQCLYHNENRKKKLNPFSWANYFSLIKIKMCLDLCT